ncbi:hypothetical protein [Nocardioides sp.]|uniref:hypothetical protein n=1 Tax=Nocardioides sp. TaxID=35761 RepID=UPI0025E6D5D2|nr:hypothetical protein [Nocardioides sp.]
MHGRSPLVAAVLLLIGVLLLVPAPADADATLDFDRRPAGLPATTEPAQTLSAADATLGTTSGGSALRAVVQLGGVPGAETAADLHLRIGTPVDGACRTDWELVVPTLEPTGFATRDGATIRIAASMEGREDLGLRCGSVALVGMDGAVLDQLDEDESGTVIVDPGSRSRIERVVGTAVRPGRWSTVWVRVRHRGADAVGVRITGRGDGVRARTHTEAVTLRDGGAAWVPLEVRLRGERPRRLTIRAWAVGDIAFAFPGTREVRLRPTR